MAIGIAFWSMSTVLGSFMTVYGYFLATRILVGIGYLLLVHLKCVSSNEQLRFRRSYVLYRVSYTNI